MSVWSVTLNGVTISADEDVDTDAVGCLTEPIEGLGLTPLRTEDVTYPQRDGVRHFADWHEPRIITLSDVSVCPDLDCDGDCLSAKAKVKEILKAWSRRCDDTELVIRTDCDPGTSEDRYNLAVTPQPSPDWVESPPPLGPFPRQDVWETPGTNFTREYFDLATPPEAGITGYTRYYRTSGAQSVIQYGMGTSSLEGKTGAVSVWARFPSTEQVTFFTASMPGFVYWANEVFNPPANTWVKYTATGVFGADSTFVGFQIPEEQSGSDITGLIIEEGVTTTGPYFDGSTEEAEWTGDPGDGPNYLGTGTPYSSQSFTGPDRSLTGPFGVVGRPRVAEVTWLGGPSGCADMLLRFDGVDQRMYILDADGNPGSGQQCVTLTPNTQELAACLPACFQDDPGTLNRTNLHTNPDPREGSGFYWTSTGRSVSTQFRSVADFSGMEYSMFDSPPANLNIWTQPQGASPVTPGDTINFSAWVERSAPGNLQVQLEWFDGGSVSYTPTDWRNVGALTNYVSSAVVPAGTVGARLVVTADGSTLQPGDTVFAGGVMMLANNPDLSRPFSGDTISTLEYTYNWTGVPSASTSEEWTGATGGDWCFTTQAGDPGAGPVTFTVKGDTCVNPVITLYGPLTNPIIENLTNGQSIGYGENIGPNDPPVIINTEQGTATQGGVNRTHLITGNPRLLLEDGENVLRLISTRTSDSGYAEVCWRPVAIGM